MRCLRRARAVLCALVVANVLSAALFLNGFLHVTDAISRQKHVRAPFLDKRAAQGVGGDSGPDDADSAHTRAPFGTLVLLVIDALRSDFVFGGGDEAPMPLLRNRMMDGTALGFVSVATTPTVTLPRLKAIVGGVAPSFVDALFNFNSAAYDGDNIIDAAVDAGRRVVFYGDDTWLRLLPGRFLRNEGTSSFFVSDYTEVDDNVTRHVRDELQRRDWDVAVLHYLGLDHIGHGHAASHALIARKLSEMDGIIEEIVQSLAVRDRPSLVVVCGDHGMTRAGGHGGSSPDETHTALAFVSPAFHVLSTLHGNPLSRNLAAPPKVRQTQIAASIAPLLGLRTPRNSREFGINDVLQRALSRESAWRLTRERATDLLASTEMHSVGTQASLKRLLEDAEKAHACALTAASTSSARSAEEAHAALVDAFVDALGASSAGHESAFDVAEMVAGMASAVVAVVGAGLALHRARRTNDHTATAAVFASVDVSSASQLCDALHRRASAHNVVAGRVGVGVVLTHALLMSASSFVEEEHCVWYFGASTLAVAYVCVDVAALLYSHRVGLRSGSDREHDDHVSPRFKASALGPIVADVLLLATIRLCRAFSRNGARPSDTPALADVIQSSSPSSAAAVAAASALAIACVATAVVKSKLPVFSTRNVRVPVGLRMVSVGLLFVYALLVARALSYLQCAQAAGVGAPQSWACDVASASAALTPVAALTVFICAVVLCRDFAEGQFYWVAALSASAVVCVAQPAHKTPIFVVFCAQAALIIAKFGALVPSERVQPTPFVSSSSLALVFLLFSKCAHFAQGNSNALSTLDIAGAYAGASEFSQFRIGLLAFFGNVGNQIVWPLVALAVGSERGSAASAAGVMLAWTMPRSLSLSAVLASVFSLRSHLFVWSVFAPKLLYEAVETVSYAVVALLCIGTSGAGNSKSLN